MGKVESEVVFSMLLLYSSSKFKDIAFHIQAISLHQWDIWAISLLFFWTVFEILYLGISLLGFCSKNSIIRAHKIPLSHALDVSCAVSLMINKARALRTLPDTVQSTIGIHYFNTSWCLKLIRCVNNIPTMQFFTGISRNSQSKSYMISLTECLREFQNNALWDTN